MLLTLINTTLFLSTAAVNSSCRALPHASDEIVLHLTCFLLVIAIHNHLPPISCPLVVIYDQATHTTSTCTHFIKLKGVNLH